MTTPEQRTWEVYSEQARLDSPDGKHYYFQVARPLDVLYALANSLNALDWRAKREHERAEAAEQSLARERERAEGLAEGLISNLIEPLRFALNDGRFQREDLIRMIDAALAASE